MVVKDSDSIDDERLFRTRPSSGLMMRSAYR